MKSRGLPSVLGVDEYVLFAKRMFLHKCICVYECTCHTYIYIYISIYIQFLSTFAIVALLIEEIHLNHVNIAGPYNGFMYLNWCRF